MKNTDKLVFLYFYICDCYDSKLVLHCQRMSNNSKPPFSDEEVLTIYLYCLVVEGRKQIKDIYNFADNYLRSWFPKLGSTYESFLMRLNKLCDVFPVLVCALLEQKTAKTCPEKLKLYDGLLLYLMDSMPIILAAGKRSCSAKVALNLCDKGYCSTKNLYYHGVKLHVLGYSCFDALPIPDYVGISPASHNDLTVLKPVVENIFDRAFFGDKIYHNYEFWDGLKTTNNLHFFAPIKLEKGQKKLKSYDKIYSTLVSKIRQPIESFFNWIIEKTNIQKASKVRSSDGLLVHVFGRFAGAIASITLGFL